jgi:transposase InsO family protein
MPAGAGPRPSARPGIAQHSFSQRGLPSQRLQRQREYILRGNIAELRRYSHACGLSFQDFAELVNISERTLRDWHQLLEGALPVLALGRPALRSSRQQRNQVLDLLDELGPATGVPLLRDAFPNMPRAELDDLVKRYRRVWQLRHTHEQYRLRWTIPGSVWAMDFAQAPHPIDGLYPYLLAVRDLASGQQLLWLPVTNADAEAALAALRQLFLVHGAPLLLKTDNGSPFCAGATLELLLAWSVLPLFSPPYCPRYNGSIEAGIGSLKTRTEHYATQNGHPTFWTFNDTAAAQEQANATARPQGPNGPTADQLWHARPTITPQQRTGFNASVAYHRDHVRAREGQPSIGPLPKADPRALDRQAIRRALGELGFLFFKRRTIPLSFFAPKTATIR